MKNWKTSLLGLGFGVGNLIVAQLQTGSVNWRDVLLSAAVGALGLAAKDHNVTGGDVHQ